MDVRIGVIDTMKEIDVELPQDADPDDIRTRVEKAIGDASGVLWLADRHGRQIGVAAARIAYVELGRPDADRRIGFGS